MRRWLALLRTPFGWKTAVDSVSAAVTTREKQASPMVAGTAFCIQDSNWVLLKAV